VVADGECAADYAHDGSDEVAAHIREADYGEDKYEYAPC